VPPEVVIERDQRFDAHSLMSSCVGNHRLMWTMNTQTVCLSLQTFTAVNRAHNGVLLSVYRQQVIIVHVKTYATAILTGKPRHI